MLKVFIGIGMGFLLFSNQGARQTTADILRFGMVCVEEFGRVQPSTQIASIPRDLGELETGN